MGLTEGGLFPPYMVNKMAKNDKVNMPSSTAGITRYFDEYRSKIEFSPGHIIILSLIVIIILAVLHTFGSSWLGI